MQKMQKMITCEECFHDKDRGSCCRRRPGEVPFPIMPEEVEHMGASTGRIKERVAYLRQYTEEEISLLTSQSPLWAYAFYMDRRAWVLVTDEDGVCTFLEDGHGCTIKGIRPSICKLYPFFLTTAPDGGMQLALTYGNHCPIAVETGGNEKMTLEGVGMTREELVQAAEELVRRLYATGG